MFKRFDLLLEHIETLVPTPVSMHTEPGFSAYRWRAQGLEGIARFDQVDRTELLHL